MIRCFRQLFARNVEPGSPRFTDADLEKHLRRLPRLQSLELKGTRVTDAGGNGRKKVLPNVSISR